MARSLQSIRRNQPLKEQVYQALRSAILSGDLVPGQRLVEAQLAQMLNVSRTPIREALRQLHHEKLVTSSFESDGVLRVAIFSARDAAEFYECRLALEQLSVAAACHHATDRQLQELHRLMQKADKLATNQSSQLLNFQLLELDYQFHRLLAESSENLQLQSMLDHLFDKMMLMRIQTMQQNRDVLDIGVEHRRIYDAVLQRQPEAAIVAVRDHLLAAKQRVVCQIQQHIETEAT